MAGGLLNIIAIGNNNVFLTGNPSKTFFKVTYSKYTNFGLQKFRIDYDGGRDLRLTETSTFTFKIPRYAELLMDTYLVVTLPDIWSPIHNPNNFTNNYWASYDYRWIRNLGTTMIKEISITCGSATLQKYSGQYLAAMVDRDFTTDKKNLFNKMTGNYSELYDPGNAFNRINTYPSAFYTDNPTGSEPSIRGRNLYIPINTWFTLNNGMAFPLIALQYNELYITVTLRPIQELFQIRDVFDYHNNFPYIQPDFTQSHFQMYRFLQTPPTVILDSANYENTISVWNADVHLISTYAFLSSDEAKQFALNEQIYLVKDVFEYFFENVTGSSRIKLTSNGMISNWMWFLQRNDVNLRNEWSNYTNFPYRTIPAPLINNNDYGSRIYNFGLNNTVGIPNESNINLYNNLSLSVHPNDGSVTGLSITGDYQVVNQREILQSMGIILDGEYRENVLTRGIYDYIEKYTRTTGFAEEGLYCYNFCLNTSPFEYQPSGAINLNKFKNIQLELTTYIPQFDPIGSSFNVLCNTDGTLVGVKKSSWQLYEYNYNLTLFEERYNILSFISGNCGMLYAR